MLQTFWQILAPKSFFIDAIWIFVPVVFDLAFYNAYQSVLLHTQLTFKPQLVGSCLVFYKIRLLSAIGPLNVFLELYTS